MGRTDADYERVVQGIKMTATKDSPCCTTGRIPDVQVYTVFLSNVSMFPLSHIA